MNNIFKALNDLDISNYKHDPEVKILNITFRIAYANPNTGVEETFDTPITVNLNKFPNKYKRDILKKFIDYCNGKAYKYQKININSIVAL